jgi:hypothetical protein
VSSSSTKTVWLNRVTSKVRLPLPEGEASHNCHQRIPNGQRECKRSVNL